MSTTYNPYSLEGKTILVTGASSGIGQTTAVECSKLGATLVITGRNIKRLQETLYLLDTSLFQQHQLLVADLLIEDDIDALVSKIGSIDGLVNNAGANRVKPISFIQKEDLSYIFENNFFSSALLTKTLLKKKKIKKEGSIVFTSSISAFYNAPGRVLYSSSKAALTSLMKSVAVELANKGIRANAVHPGLVETKFIHESLTEEELSANISEYPLNRLGKPEDVAWAIAYLLSDASKWVTGSSLVIDGGFMLK